VAASQAEDLIGLTGRVRNDPSLSGEIVALRLPLEIPDISRAARINSPDAFNLSGELMLQSS
jgi:hypothetical protein